MEIQAYYKNIARLYYDVLKNPEVKVILTMEPKEYNFIEREYPAFIKVFETVRLKSRIILNKFKF